MDLFDSPYVQTYLLALYLPVGLLFAIFMILYVTIITIISIRKSWNKPIPAVWRAIIDITFTGGLKTKTEDGKIQYFLFDYPVTPMYVRSIGLFAISLWQSLLITFWLNFIIKVSDDCNNGACFFANDSKITTDCLMESIRASQSSNSSITCYEFQFDFINGAGTAGGLLTISITIIYGQLSAQLWLRKKISKSSKRKYKKRWFKVSFYLLIGVVPLIVTTSLLVLGAIRFLNSSNSSIVLPSYINAVIYLVPLQVISIFPLWNNRLFTDPEADSPAPDAYTLMEDGQVPINDNYTKEQPMRKRAHTIL